MSESKTKRRQHIILEALYYQETNKRRGTAKMKTRSEVSGGGVKPWKQKGTGRARQGSTRAVQWVGGGRAFGSSYRVYNLKMNKKARAAALSALLQSKKDEGRLVFEKLSFDAPSTKKFVEMLKAKDLNGKVMFLYGPGTDANVIKSARNLPEVNLVHFDKINVKAILNCDWLLVNEAEASKLRFQPAAQGE